MAAVDLALGDEVVAGLRGLEAGDVGVAAKVTVLARQNASAAREVRMFMAISVVGCFLEDPGASPVAADCAAAADRNLAV
jgi:hypothetical protein